MAWAHLLVSVTAVLSAAVTAGSSSQPSFDATVLDKEMAELRQLVEAMGAARDDDAVRRRYRHLAEDTRVTATPPVKARVGRPWNPNHPDAGDDETVVVLAHFKEPTEWLYTRQPFDYFLVSKCCAQLGWGPYTLPINRGKPRLAAAYVCARFLRI